jgi:hypothetical protein
MIWVNCLCQAQHLTSVFMLGKELTIWGTKCLFQAQHLTSVSCWVKTSRFGEKLLCQAQHLTLVSCWVKRL